MKKYQGNLVILITVLVLLFSLHQTNSLVGSHFTHHDDIGVANTLINNKLCEILDEKREKYSAMPVLNVLYEKIASDSSACELLNSVYSYVAVPAHWTYAPVQFFFTKISLSTLNTNSYEAIKYAGRLPSFVFYILGVLAFVYLLASRKYLDYKNTALIAALALVLGMSLELRIFASQMESFAIGVLSGVLIFGATLSVYKNKYFTFKAIFLRSIVMSIGIAMQYQGIFLATACVVSLFLVDFIFEKSQVAFKRIIYIAFSMTFLSIFYLPFLLKNFGRGVNWNAGPNNTFIVSGASFFDRLIDLVRLLSHETFYNIYAISSSLQISSVYSTVNGFVLVLLFVCGLVQLYQTRSNPENILTLLVLIFYMVVTAVILLLGAISFGPTRHSLYHLFPLLLGVAFGLKLIISRFSSSLLELFIFLTSLIVALTSLAAFNSFSIQRIDPLSQEVISKYFPLTNTDLIIGENIELALFDTVKDKFILVNERPQCDKFKLAVTDKNDLQLGLYTKLNTSKLTDDTYSTEILTAFAEYCGLNNYQMRIADIQRVFSFESPQQIDISDKTQNGANSIYLYRARLFITRH